MYKTSYDHMKKKNHESQEKAVYKIMAKVPTFVYLKTVF